MTPVRVATSAPTPACGNHNVLIAYADTGPPTLLRTEILAQSGVAAVDLFNAGTGTPTLAQLQQHDIVVPFSNNQFADGVALGNNLSDYVDGGGIAVQYGFSFYGPGQPYGINGRWLTGNYNVYNYSINLLLSTAFTLGTSNAAHPLMAGVTALNSNYQNVVTLAPGATQVAAASNGNSLVAYRPVSDGHTTIGVTGLVGAAATQSGDWGRVIVNAANWLCAKTLSVAKTGSGVGTVTSSPAGIDCGSTCSAALQHDTQVTLTASPASGSAFTGWSGGGCSGTGSCSLTMDADKSVSATFTANPPPPPPDTKITKAKINSASQRAKFAFTATGAATDFECKLKRPHKHAGFKGCDSPKTYKHLKPGRYKFNVRAVGPGGPDPTAAKKKFKIE